MSDKELSVVIETSCRQGGVPIGLGDNMNDKKLSIAIETSCRQGGVAVGLGDNLLAKIRFDASSRHASQLISHLDHMLCEAGFSARDLAHVYVSAGPGGFTGLRIGITVARTLGQMLPELKCVAVPTAKALARSALELDWEHLGVVLASKDTSAWAALLTRDGDDLTEVVPGELRDFEQFLASAPRPLMLIGEALEHLSVSGEQITIAPSQLHTPTAENVWHVGRSLAAAGKFTAFDRLQPVYARQPEALRLWEKKLKADSAK